MIRTTDELAVVQKQLARIEEALAALKESISPKNKANFEVLSEGYIDQIALLRAEIDTYLGIGPLSAPLMPEFFTEKERN